MPHLKWSHVGPAAMLIGRQILLKLVLNEMLQEMCFRTHVVGLAAPLITRQIKPPQQVKLDQRPQEQRHASSAGRRIKGPCSARVAISHYAIGTGPGRASPAPPALPATLRDWGPNPIIPARRVMFVASNHIRLPRASWKTPRSAACILSSDLRNNSMPVRQWSLAFHRFLPLEPHRGLGR